MKNFKEWLRKKIPHWIVTIYYNSEIRDWGLVVFNFVSIIITIILVIQNRSSIDTANEALKFQQKTASQDSVSQWLKDSIAIKQFEIETRAYLVVTLFTNGERKGDSVVVWWRIDNVGKTPAFRVQFSYWMANNEIDPETLKTRYVSTIGSNIGFGVPEIMRGAWFTLPTDIPTPEDVFSGKEPVYIAIKIRYTDILKQVHHSYFHSQLFLGKQYILKPTPDND